MGREIRVWWVEMKRVERWCQRVWEYISCSREEESIGGGEGKRGGATLYASGMASKFSGE